MVPKLLLCADPPVAVHVVRGLVGRICMGLTSVAGETDDLLGIETPEVVFESKLELC